MTEHSSDHDALSAFLIASGCMPVPLSCNAVERRGLTITESEKCPPRACREVLAHESLPLRVTQCASRGGPFTLAHPLPSSGASPQIHPCLHRLREAN